MVVANTYNMTDYTYKTKNTTSVSYESKTTGLTLWLLALPWAEALPWQYSGGTAATYTYKTKN